MKWDDDILVGLLVLVGAEAVHLLIPARWRSRLGDHLGRRPRLLLVVWAVTLAIMFFGWRLGTQASSIWLNALAVLLWLGTPIMALDLSIRARDRTAGSVEPLRQKDTDLEIPKKG